jgi:hypothetical protein
MSFETRKAWGDRTRRVQAAIDQLREAPLGTKAPAFNGGAWVKVENGWRWNADKPYPGDTFPRPMGDWTGKLIYPPAFL